MMLQSVYISVLWLVLVQSWGTNGRTIDGLEKDLVPLVVYQVIMRSSDMLELRLIAVN